MDNNSINIDSVIIKQFKIVIDQPHQTYNASFTLDKTINFVKGIVLTSLRSDMLYNRGHQRIEINRKEIYPDEYLSKMLMVGLDCPQDKRFAYRGNIPAGNGILKVDYTDNANPRFPFEPYTVLICLDCEVNDFLG